MLKTRSKSRFSKQRELKKNKNNKINKKVSRTDMIPCYIYFSKENKKQNKTQSHMDQKQRESLNIKNIT